MRPDGGEAETRTEAVKQRQEAMVDIPDDEVEADIYCEVCRGGDRENLLLLCDSCDLGKTETI